MVSLSNFERGVTMARSGADHMNEISWVTTWLIQNGWIVESPAIASSLTFMDGHYFDVEAIIIDR